MHAGISPQALREMAAARPEAELYVHPECGCGTSALWQTGTGDLPAERTRVLSTGGMLEAARTTKAPAVLVATETGMLHQLRKANPAVSFEPVNPHATCHYMKMITAESLERCLRTGQAEVHVDEAVAARARRAVEAMIAVGPGAGDGGRAVSGKAAGMAGLRAAWRREADVVVVGSGAAGISVALTAAARGLRVLLVTKDLVGGATPLAQGGLAAALGAGDTPAAHVSDTLTAGAGLCEPDVVAALAAGAPGAIGWLTGLGAQLETRELRLEGGHSAHRIVHSGDDATGAEVHRALLAALLASGVEILDRTVALPAARRRR